MAGVVFDHVAKRYGAGAPTIRDLSLRIEEREFLVLVGPSGSGKSTALRMIAGLEEVSSGRLLIGDRVVNDVAPRDRDVAMVFQSYALSPHMTAAENMGFALKIRGVPAPEIRRRVAAAARSLEIEPLLDKRPKSLSGGQRQRVAIGRAIVREPKVFLMDEPLSNLDARLRVSMRAEIKRLHRRLGATVVYVTHDQTEAMTLGDRVAVMNVGELVQCDTPREVYQRPATTFVGGFIGSPAMNLLPAEVVVEAGVAAVVGPGLRFALGPRPVVAGEVTVGVRPEHLERTALDSPGGIAGEVELTEPVGSEAFVHLVSEAGPVVFRVPESGAPRAGDTVRVSAPAERLHLFDRSSGRRVG